MYEIVIDVETFSSGPNSAIATIGAIAWDRETEEVRKFYTIIKEDPKGVYSSQTIRWHIDLNVGCRSVGRQDEGVHLNQSLTYLSSFLRDHKADQRGECRIWTHATFDMPVLRSAYHRSGITSIPWSYGNCRDLRTLYDLSGGRPSEEEVGYTGNHNALEDCLSQKNEVDICLSRMGL